MDKFIRDLRKEELLVEHGGWFDEDNAERVLNWLVASENHKPVVLVGAGFSLNAHDVSSGRPASAEQAPMWAELAKARAVELGVEAQRYDAPTLFEMYSEAFGAGRLRDALRDSVDDRSLAPGDAHRALASYGAEAIVSTNCLDTLLDKACPDWRRVVTDLDLSGAAKAVEPDRGQRDLIYVHGHRDNSDTWVITRGQYEDFARNKPVILTRVRQLLAQHPWLVLGFSMSDANFHAVTRALGHEMRDHQPLSLVVMKHAPLPAERQHWRRLGFVIVTPTLRSSDDRERDFRDLFEWLLPRIETRYTPTSAAAQSYIQRGREVSRAEGLRRFREANTNTPADQPGLYAEWEDQIRSLLREDEQKQARQRAWTLSGRPALPIKLEREESAFTSQRHGTDREEELRTPALRAIEAAHPELRASSSIVVRFLDVALQGDDKFRRELAEHFAWALERELYREADHPWLLEVVTLSLAKYAPFEQSRLELLLRAALEVARRYQDEKGLATLRAVGDAIGCSVEEALREGPAPWVVSAGKAYRCFMDADFEHAAEHYESAAKQASSADRSFENWLYTFGLACAVDRQADERRWGDSEPRSRSAEDLEQSSRHLRAVVEELEQTQGVARWLDRARDRGRILLKESLEVEQERHRRQDGGSRGLRYSSAGYYASRTYREVSFPGGPPALRRRYLEPLLASAQLDLLADVLAHAPAPKAWISDRLREWSGSFSDRKRRDAGIVACFFDERARTRTELASRLQCVPTVRTVLRRGDGEQCFTWVLGCAKELGVGWKETASGSANIDGYWAAFATIAKWTDAPPAMVLEKARELLRQLNGRGGSVLEAMYALPWANWCMTDGTEAEGFFELLSNEVASARADGGGRDSRALGAGIFALRRMLDSGLAAEIVRPRREAWAELMERLRTAALPQTTYGEGKRGGFLLERKLIELGVLEPRDVAQLFQRWFPNGPREADDERDHRSEVWTVLAELLEAEELPEQLRDLLREEVECVLREGSRKFFLNNPHVSYAPKRLLARCLAELPELRARIGTRLLDMFRAAPDYLSVLGPSLYSHHWDPADWEALLDLILAASGGTVLSPAEPDDDGLAARARLEVMDLAASLEAEQLRELGLAGTAVRSLALSNATSELPTLANHAAFAVVSLAMHADDEEGAAFARTLERIANDARVPVRLAAADAGLALSKRAKSDRVRRAAEAALTQLADDDNGQVWRVLERARRAEESQSLDPATSAP